jgi:hypothetical protein
MPAARRLFSAVIAGLDPAIHLASQESFEKLMDTRVKPAHDDLMC